MEGLERVLDDIASLRRRGAYADVAALEASLPAALRREPEVCLQTARARVSQGRIADARAALTSADLDRATPALRLLLALEDASLLITANVDFCGALESVDDAFARAPLDAISPGDLAAAERLRTRIMLSAATYFEIDADAAEKARAGLTALADRLEGYGQVDEALAARLTHADRHMDKSERARLLDDLAARATAARRPAVAAGARLTKAQDLIVADADPAAIETELEAARTAFDLAGHVHGGLDVAVASARMKLGMGTRARDELEECARAYEELDHAKGLLNALLELSRDAHERGDGRAAEGYRRRGVTLARQIGLGLVLPTFQLAEAHLFMRSNNPSTAIELCESVLAETLPRVSRGLFEQLLSAAHGFSGATSAAVDHSRRALAIFDELGAHGHASLAATKLANDLVSLRNDKGRQEAEALAAARLVQDEQCGDLDGAIAKMDVLIRMSFEKLLYGPARYDSPALLNQAETWIGRAEATAARLAPRERMQSLANMAQRRAHLAQVRGDDGGVERELTKALELYQAGGRAMEAANCRYLLGTQALNRALHDPAAHFDGARNRLDAAISYYDNEGMRQQAGDTFYMLGLLYENTAARIPSTAERARPIALEHLANSEARFDAARRDCVSVSVLDALVAKRTLSQRSARTYDLALKIVANRLTDASQAWRWAQRAKARALVDALANGVIASRRMTAAVAANVELDALVEKERELTREIRRASPDRRSPLRKELAALRQRMTERPELVEYVEMRTGIALEPDDFDAMLAAEVPPGERCVCVDWIAGGDALFVLTRTAGSAPQMVQLAMTVSQARSFVRQHLAGGRFRSTLIDNAHLLRQLDPLIAPLVGQTAPGDLLVLSPTGPLFALPLHALENEGEPLLARNPVVYNASLGALRQCFARRRGRRLRRTAALFGAPGSDLGALREYVGRLASRLEGESVTGEDLTREKFLSALPGRDIIHFGGHARHDAVDPLLSCLDLAGSRLTARDVFEHADLSAELVTLAACESAASVISEGDEPLGLIPAFLCAGAGAVLATLWRVFQGSAQDVMQRFYDEFLVEGAPPLDKARALQRAALAAREKWPEPYHWAPFVLHGDWR